MGSSSTPSRPHILEVWPSRDSVGLTVPLDEPIACEPGQVLMMEFSLEQLKGLIVGREARGRELLGVTWIVLGERRQDATPRRMVQK